MGAARQSPGFVTPSPATKSSPSIRVGWERHWDPHPICWLERALSTAPYGWRSLGMRSCHAGGVAITVPSTPVLVGASPVDPHRTSWSVHTHDPTDPDGHQPIHFGTFTWIHLDNSAFDRDAESFTLPDGSTLKVADRRGKREVRYRIVSRADPGRLISGTDTWADLAAVEQIAAWVHTWMEQVAPRA